MNRRIIPFALAAILVSGPAVAQAPAAGGEHQIKGSLRADRHIGSRLRPLATIVEAGDSQAEHD